MIADNSREHEIGAAAEQTLAFEPVRTATGPSVRRFRIVVLKGPETGISWESGGDSGTDRCSIGSHPSNNLVIQDPTVSRFHCEIQIAQGVAKVHDLNSRNGTVVDGVQVIEAYVRNGSTIRMGATAVRFDLFQESQPLSISERTQFGSLVGVSVAMRSVFALLERAACTDATILLEGETGTGKGQMAQSIHRAGARKDAPFLTLDCSAIPASLLESELFGHEKGSFSGATDRRLGLFEEAHGGTIFLDEIGELTPDLQPKLLRVLEDRVVRPIGSNRERSVRVRVIAATNRDLRAEVNLGRFRSDLYFRLAVVKISIPPLRSRPEDVPILVEHMLRSFGAGEPQAEALRSPEFLQQIGSAAWPGNVRELRNYIERCLVFEDALPVNEHSPSTPPSSSVGADLPLAEARKRALDDFERRYLEELLRLHDGKMGRAADAAGIDRTYLYKLLVKAGLKSPT